MLMYITIVPSTYSRDGMNQAYPQESNINQPIAAIGKDVQPAPKDFRKAPVKGGKQPRKHLAHKVLRKGITPTGGIKKPHRY